jgi:hypothetical protein
MFIFTNQNRHLFDVAYAMFMRGEWFGAVLREVWKENSWCRPPLTTTEVKTVVVNARRYVGGDENNPEFQQLLDRIRFARLT